MVQGRERWAGCRMLLARVAIGVVLLVALGLAGAWVASTEPEGECDGAAKPGVIAFEFAGTRERTREILGCWTPADRDDVRSGLDRDTVFVATYVAALAFWCAEGSRRFRTRTPRRLGVALAIVVPVAGVLDLAENHYLREVLSRYEDGRDVDLPAVQHALTATLPKWVVVVVATAYALAVFVVCVWTLVTIAWNTVRGRLPLGRDGGPHPLQRAPDEEAWAWAAHPPGTPGRPDDLSEHPVGICLSGGGIRSASFNLGALQVLQERPFPGDPAGRNVLARADYLTSVSGGGYVAGAFQMLLHRSGADPDQPRFARGTPEEDHLRRHSRYLADSVTEWLHAVFRFLTGFALNLAVFFLLLYAVARPLGWIQRDLLFGLDRDRNLVVRTTRGMWMAVVWLAAAAAVCVLVAILWRLTKQRHAVRATLWRAATALAAVGLGVFAVVWALPTLDQAVRTGLEFVLGESSSNEGKKTDASALVLAAVGIVPTALAAVQAAGNRFGRRLGRVLAPVAVVLLAFTALVLFANLVDDAARLGPRGEMGLVDAEELWVWTVVVLVLLALFVLVDQTQWSLYPLYKRRLAFAFAVEREDGRARAIDYDVPTTLSQWAAPIPGFPKLVLCAAANVSGSDLTPPGRRVLTFTFEHDFVGGPEIGWARTVDLEDVLGDRNRPDGTLLSALAISGAAFASAMGRHSRPGLNVLLAVSNARLGVWLPSPDYVNHLCGTAADDRHPVPEPWITTRRFTYLLKEVFGAYDPDDRYLYVTDGGHLENLGLVELLRRRCLTIVCFDASGGDPDFCGTLAEAIALARQQLGVEIEIDVTDLAPATAAEPDGPNTARNLLARRTSKTAIAVGDIGYPAVGEKAAVTGRLVFAKAVLDEGLPPDVLHHASGAEDFPNDPTGDQFFDHAQFAAYHALGTYVAEKAVERLG